MSSCGTVRLIPGPRGQDGATGAAGAAGVSAFTTLTAAFTMPAEQATASATVADSSWMTTGMYVYLQGAGWMEVTAIADSTHATLKNLENTATSAYTINVAPGTVVANGSKIVATGPQGPAGTAGSSGAPTGATYITSTPHADLSAEVPLSGLATGLVHSTTGTGAVATIATGTANTAIPRVDDAAGLTNNEAVFATATGIESKTAANARTSLGLGTISTQAANNVAITGGTLANIATASITALDTQTLITTGTSQFNGVVGLFSKLLFSASTLQSLLAATQINPNAPRVRVVGNGGAVTLTGVPTISPTTDDGQFLIIQGTSNANTVTLQDSATLPGSQLELGAATRVLGAGDTIVLIWDLATTSWYEMAFSNV